MTTESENTGRILRWEHVSSLWSWTTEGRGRWSGIYALFITWSWSCSLDFGLAFIIASNYCKTTREKNVYTVTASKMAITY